MLDLGLISYFFFLSTTCFYYWSQPSIQFPFILLKCAYFMKKNTFVDPCFCWFGLFITFYFYSNFRFTKQLFFQSCWVFLLNVLNKSNFDVPALTTFIQFLNKPTCIFDTYIYLLHIKLSNYLILF